MNPLPTPRPLRALFSPTGRSTLSATLSMTLSASLVLAVGDVLIRSGGDAAVVARASMTYSIPPKG